MSITSLSSQLRNKPFNTYHPCLSYIQSEWSFRIAEPLPQRLKNNLINAGYMPCDGRTLSKTNPQYVALFGQIDTFYGSDDGNFCVPDYRGRFMRGTDYGAGRDKDAASRTAPTQLKYPGNSGDNVGSLEAGGVLAHTHTFASNGGDYWRNNYGCAQSPGVFTEDDTTSADSSATGGVETRPKNVYINYVIVFI